MNEFFTPDYEAAATLLEQALKIYLEVGHPLGQAHAHGYLAGAQQRIAGREEEAVVNLQAATDLYARLGNKLGGVNLLIWLGKQLRKDNPAEAVARLNEAVVRSTELDGEFISVSVPIGALDELAEIYRERGNQQAARDAWLCAQRLAREHGIQRDVDDLAGKLESVRSPSGRRPRGRWIGSLSRWKR
jgi:tetratricopeptide (TPR) repeat protein